MHRFPISKALGAQISGWKRMGYKKFSESSSIPLSRNKGKRVRNSKTECRLLGMHPTRIARRNWSLYLFANSAYCCALWQHLTHININSNKRHKSSGTKSQIPLCASLYERNK